MLSDNRHFMLIRGLLLPPPSSLLRSSRRPTSFVCTMATTVPVPGPLLGVVEPHPDSPTPFRFDVSTSDISALAEAIISHADTVLDSVAAVAPDAATWDTVGAPLADLDAAVEPASTNTVALKDLSPDKDIRDASAAAASKLSDWEVTASMRVDVYRAVEALAGNDAEMERLGAEERRFVERTLRDKRRLGLHLDDDTRKVVGELKTRMSKLCIEYQRNLGEVDDKLFFKPGELAGMPEPFVGALAKREEDGALEVTMGYPHVVPILKLCTVEATRMAVERAFNSRAMAVNVPILEELTALRARLANILGYPNHAAFTLETRMAKSPEVVAEFLGDLEAKLRAGGDAELAELSALKAEVGSEAPLGYWDFRFLQHALMERKYAVDMKAIEPYFPLEGTVAAMLRTYSKLFGLTFTPVDGVHAWHEDVTVRAVADTRTGTLLGHVYFDMHPREGKYGHAAVFPLVASCEYDGSRRLPAAALVCNFTKPTADTPSLLTHLETHEAGHAIHHLCSRTKLHKWSGFSVETDFVEAPSQLLENWVWNPEMLVNVSGHYQTGEKLPLEIATKLAATRDAHVATDNLRQVMLATFDQRIHGITPEEKVSTDAVLTDLHTRILGIPMTPGTNFSASFGHLAGGYDSQYYGYLYSEVFAFDIMSQFHDRGLLSDDIDEVGVRYRETVLQRGGTVDALELVTDFLGRPPNTQAFLAAKGLA